MTMSVSFGRRTFRGTRCQRIRIRRWNPSAFASNRFGATANALEFVNELYAAGASEVCVDNEQQLPSGRQRYCPGLAGSLEGGTMFFRRM